MSSHNSTPYETGDRHEPSLRIDPENIYGWPGPDYLTDQHDQFGKVDFESHADGTTECTVHIEHDELGRPVIVIDSQRSADEVLIRLELADRIVTLDGSQSRFDMEA